MTVDTLQLPVSVVSDVSDTDLFPLPLVAFEQYMVADDRADYPTNFFLRLRFSGVFDRSAFQAAVATALRRHPLLRARIRPSGRGRFEWVAAEHPEPLITWRTGAAPSTSAACPRIDLHHETGLRIFVGQREDRTEMLLQFHHACCDAQGAMQVVEDLLAVYHDAVGGLASQQHEEAAAHGSRRIALPPLDLGRLRLRGRFGMNLLRYLLRVPKELIGALGVVEYFVLRPVALAPLQDDAVGRPDAEGFPACCAHTFTVSETNSLRRATKQIGCTVNDLLLRDLFLAVREWMTQHDPESLAGVVRIMIPTNLRTSADALMPAANVVGMVFNDRRPRKFSTPRRLMGILRTEMNLCKRWRLGLSMVHVVRAARKFRGGLRWLLREDRCLATAVLSNLGELDGRSGLCGRDGRMTAAGVTLETVELLPPLRPLTHASFGVVSYAGRLTVGLNYDPRRFTARHGRQLLDAFVQRIRRSLAEVD